MVERLSEVVTYLKKHSCEEVLEKVSGFQEEMSSGHTLADVVPYLHKHSQAGVPYLQADLPDLPYDQWSAYAKVWVAYLAAKSALMSKNGALYSVGWTPKQPVTEEVMQEFFQRTEALATFSASFGEQLQSLPYQKSLPDPVEPTALAFALGSGYIGEGTERWLAQLEQDVPAYLQLLSQFQKVPAFNVRSVESVLEFIPVDFKLEQGPAVASAAKRVVPFWRFLAGVEASSLTAREFCGLAGYLKDSPSVQVGQLIGYLLAGGSVLDLQEIVSACVAFAEGERSLAEYYHLDVARREGVLSADLPLLEKYYSSKFKPLVKLFSSEVRSALARYERLCQRASGDYLPGFPVLESFIRQEPLLKAEAAYSLAQGLLEDFGAGRSHFLIDFLGGFSKDSLVAAGKLVEHFQKSGDDGNKAAQPFLAEASVLQSDEVLLQSIFPLRDIPDGFADAVGQLLALVPSAGFLFVRDVRNSVANFHEMQRILQVTKGNPYLPTEQSEWTEDFLRGEIGYLTYLLALPVEYRNYLLGALGTESGYARASRQMYWYVEKLEESVRSLEIFSLYYHTPTLDFEFLKVTPKSFWEDFNAMALDAHEYFDRCGLVARLESEAPALCKELVALLASDLDASLSTVFNYKRFMDFFAPLLLVSGALDGVEARGVKPEPMPVVTFSDVEEGSPVLGLSPVAEEAEAALRHQETTLLPGAAVEGVSLAQPASGLGYVTEQPSVVAVPHRHRAKLDIQAEVRDGPLPEESPSYLTAENLIVSPLVPEAGDGVSDSPLPVGKSSNLNVEPEPEPEPDANPVRCHPCRCRASWLF